MLNDRYIWRNSILVMSFNVMLFSYYSLAPFIFKKKVLVLLILVIAALSAIGTLIGALTNKRLIKKDLNPKYLSESVVLLHLLQLLSLKLQEKNLVSDSILFYCHGIRNSYPEYIKYSAIQVQKRNRICRCCFRAYLLYFNRLGLVITGAIQHLGLSLSIFPGLPGAILLLKNTATL